MAAPTIGAGVKGNVAGGAGPISISFTVGTTGNSVLVATTTIDPSAFVATAVTGISGVTFTKIKEGTPVSESGFTNYKGAPSLWLANNIAAGTYTINVEFSGATDIYGSAVVQELSPVSGTFTSTSNSGTSNMPDSGAISIVADSLTVTLCAYSPNPGSGNIGFADAPSGWVRQGVENNNSSYTGLVCDSYSSATAGTISETFPNTDGGPTEWSVISVTFTSAVATISRRPIVVSTNGFQELPIGDLTGLLTHSLYSNRTADDHTQYHTDARGDARYPLLSHTLPAANIQKGSALGQQNVKWSGSSWAPGFQNATGNAITTSTTSDVPYTGNDLKTVDRLVVGLEANGVYQIDCLFSVSHGSSTVFTMRVDTPTGARNMVEIVASFGDTATSLTRLRTIFPNAASALNSCSVTATANSATNSTFTSRISGIIRNGATPGDCQILFTTATGTTTVLSGSFLQLWKLA